jgi:hypothetical protein
MKLYWLPAMQVMYNIVLVSTDKTEIAFSPFRENPRLLSTYITNRSNHKQDKTAGLWLGRNMVRQDW